MSPHMSGRQPAPQRRTLLKGAVWTAPVIVVATAVPAVAASAPAAVTTVIPNTTDDANQKVPVTVNFVNANTGGTGSTTVAARFVPAAGLGGNLQGTVTNAPPTGVTAGWAYVNTTGTDTDRTFNFLRTAGIAGASTPTGSATTTLTFTVTIGLSGLFRSAGTITTVSTPTSGTIANGSGAWT